MMIILPNYVSDIIDAKLNAEIEKYPDAENDREVLRQQLINHFAETGNVPDFSLRRNPTTQEPS